MVKKAGKYIRGALKSTSSIVYEAIVPALILLKALLGYVGDVVEFLLPYVMLYLGGQLYAARGKQTFGGELFVPIVVFFAIRVIRVCADRANVGRRVPLPKKRFTEVDDDGEVSIENSRIQELLLYVADLEDWFHRKGWL